jgi:hypothetical protein
MDSMKKFITLLLCFQFLVFPLSLTYADDLPVPDGIEDEVAKDPFASNSSTGEADGGYDFYFRQVLVLSLSIIGSSIMTQCMGFWKVPSMDIYIAAAALFILHEMTDGKAQMERRNKAFEELEAKDKNIAKSGSEKQEEVLEESKENEEELLEYIINKRNWAIGLEAVLLTATGVAIAEEIYSMSAATAAAVTACNINATVLACEAAATSAAVASLGTGAVASAAAIAACHAACNTAANVGTAAVHAPFVVQPRAVGTAACAPTAVYAVECNAHLNAYLGLGCAECNPILIPEQKFWTALVIAAITAIWGMGVNSSDGGLINQGGMLIYGALGFLLSFTDAAFLPLVSTLYDLPVPRSITFGAQAALFSVILGGLVHRQVVVEENIKKLDKVIKDFVVTSNEDGNSSVYQSDQSLSDSGPKSGTLKKTDINVKTGKTCMGADAKISSSSCSNPRKFNKPKFEFGDLGVLSTAGNLAVDAANSMAAGNTEAANTSIGQLGNLAGSIRKATGQLKKKLNDLRKSEGLEPIDFDKEIKKQIAQFEGVMNKAVASKGLPTLGQSAAGLATLDTETPTPTVAAAPVAAPAAPSADKKPSFDFGLDDEEIPQEGGALGDVAQTGDGIDKFDANVADISNKTDVSIFVQLSNRYLLNYTKIFKKVEEKPKVETPKKEEGAKK